MRIIPFHIWLITFFSALFCLFLFPAWQLYTSVLIGLHIAIFSLGIWIIRLQFFCPAFCHAPPQSNAIALTFDDGPDPDLTPEILAILNKHGIPVTFFVIGQQARNNPSLVKQCFDAGHSIACHDLTHSIFSNFRFTKRLVHDIEASQVIIKDIIGKKPLLYRPPIGLTNPHIHSALQKLGMSCIGWSIKTGDAGNRKLHKIQNIHSCAKPGAVIMLHDCLPEPSYKEDFLRQIELLCVSIHEKHLAAVVIGDMFGIKTYG